MNYERFRFVEEWSEEDLNQLPNEESGFYEYKSSRITSDKLIDRISIAASAFWNSGGGVFIVGVNDQGKIDGGILPSIGRQKLRDWVDQAISHTEPIGPYAVRIVESEHDNSSIEQGKVILVLSFGESFIGPHMASDKKYYIRAGAHSGPAAHFLVESIRSRRGLHRPLLTGMVKSSSNRLDVEQLVVLALNDAAALEVTISLDPMPKAFKGHFEDRFPLTIPVIDKKYPFSMDISIFGLRSRVFGEEPINLILTYKDIVGRTFNDSYLIDPRRSTAPMQAGKDIKHEIKQAIESISSEIKSLRYELERKGIEEREKTSD